MELKLIYKRHLHANSNNMKKCVSDSQEDDLPVDVRSKGEGRGEGLLAERVVTLLHRRFDSILSELLLPRRKSLDIHKLGASTQRIHPLWHYKLTQGLQPHGLY